MRSRLKHFFARPEDGPHAPWRIFWVALAVRLLYMTLAHTWRIRPVDDHYTFGFEAGRIARALVTGYGYADPFANAFVAHTGPTAWLPPLYPLLMAAVFKVFGVYTALSAWIILAINCAFSAWTAMAVWELGARFTGLQATNLRLARWSGWLWALYPAAMQYAVKWVWEMTITTALLAWVLVLMLRMRRDPELRPVARWAWFGLLWGLIALSNATLLLFLPVCGLWLLRHTHDPRTYAGTTLAAMLCLALIAPWTLRNQRVFHAFIPMRGNLGAELYLANGPGANGLLMEHNHPFQAPDQLRLYRDLGEVAYVKMRGDRAKAIIAADPWLFARNTLRRIDFFWASVPHPIDGKPLVELFRTLDYGFLSLAGLLGLALAWRRRLPLAGVWAWAFLLLPLPYYPVTVHARFRHPLEPMICVLAVYLFQSTERRKTTTDQTDNGRITRPGDQAALARS